MSGFTIAELRWPGERRLPTIEAAAMLAINTGRRPTRSLRRPQSGAVIIDISEKVAKSMVICRGDAANRSA